MREIKFRARNAGLPRCWVYGYFVVKNGECLIVNEDGEFKVIAGTESQYTGMKDRNGKEIYEGDLLSWGEYLLVCKWQQDNCRYSLYNTKSGRWAGFLDKHMVRDIRVVGDIYENKELLEADNVS